MERLPIFDATLVDSGDALMGCAGEEDCSESTALWQCLHMDAKRHQRRDGHGPDQPGTHIHPQVTIQLQGPATEQLALRDNYTHHGISSRSCSRFITPHYSQTDHTPLWMPETHVGFDR